LFTAPITTKVDSLVPAIQESNSPLSDPFISSTSNDTDNDFNVFSNGQDFSTFSSVSDAQTTISTIESLDNKSGLEHLIRLWII
jgi:hypothetical protein